MLVAGSEFIRKRGNLKVWQGGEKSECRLVRRNPENKMNERTVVKEDEVKAIHVYLITKNPSKAIRCCSYVERHVNDMT